MKDVYSLSDIPGYVNIKGAAELLNVAESSVYRYIQSGRLPARHAGRTIMIELDELKKFKPGITGRPRKKASPWRVSPDTSAFIITYIRVRANAHEEATLERKLSAIRQEERHTFPGTVTRYISKNDTSPATVTIQLVWKQAEMPDEETRQKEFAAFKQELTDVLDWETATESIEKVLIHT